MMGKGHDRGARLPCVVPDLVGLEVADAHDAALDAGVLAVVVNPGPRVVAQVVVAQQIRAGAQVARGQQVAVRVQTDGGGGARTPRGPTPRVGQGYRQLS